MSMNAVQLEAFEGPLDLLLNLIAKNEIDIYDIPIAEITNQYLSYIYMLNEFNIELASEFIVMASHLIEIKSKMMLPPDESDIEDSVDPREELMNRLIEYKVFKQISTYIKDHEDAYSRMIAKEPQYYPEMKTDFTDWDISAQLLSNTMRALMVKHKIQLEDLTPSYHLEAEIVSVNDKIIYLTGLLKTNNILSFFHLFETHTSKNHIVATFLAILELLKRNMILLEQDTSFEDIKIIRIQGEYNG